MGVPPEERVEGAVLMGDLAGALARVEAGTVLLVLQDGVPGFVIGPE